MPHLPKNLAPVCEAVASILSHYLHVGNLYDAGEIANALNIEVNVAGNNTINAGVDVTLLLRAFANEWGVTPFYLTMFSAARRAGTYCTSIGQPNTDDKNGGTYSPFLLGASDPATTRNTRE